MRVGALDSSLDYFQILSAAPVILATALGTYLPESLSSFAQMYLDSGLILSLHEGSHASYPIHL